jgi:sugar lactone lactonase YvrE
MKRKTISSLVILLLSSLVFYSCNDNATTPVDSNSSQILEKNKPTIVTVSTFATGLNNPRGLKFGHDGYLYVAEAGTGGSLTSDCDQVIPPIGPYTGGYTSRISKISPAGVVSTVVDNLPSSQTSAPSGSLVGGVADVAFINGTLYGIEAGAGCSHGLTGTDNTIFRVNPNGTTTTIVNLSEYQKANPVTNPEEDDFEPDGTWYSMIAVRGNLYAIEPNHGEMVKVTTSGKIRRVIDVSATQGHIVPTVVAYHGNFYIGNLGLFPVIPGSSSIFKVTPSGQIKKDASGLTTVLGIAFDNKDRMYVLESMTAPGFPAPPGSGKIVRILPSGQQEEIVTDLVFPAGMTMGPDGNLYVSNKGFGIPDTGAGEILKIELQKQNGKDWHDNDHHKD